MKSVNLLMVLFLSLSIIATAALAKDTGDVLRLRADMDRYDLGQAIYILEDIQGSWTIAELSSPEFQDRFRPNPGSLLHLSATQSVVWLRIRLATTAAISRGTPEWFLDVGNPNLDTVDFYSPLYDSPGNFHLKTAGALKPFSLREINFRSFVFKLHQPAGTVATYYIRLENHAQLIIPFTLWSPDAFRDHVLYDFFGFGIMYGMLLAMAMFNLFVFFSLRDRVYLMYVLYMVSMLMYLLCVYGQIMVIVDPGSGNALLLLWLFLGIMVCFSSQFAREFLNTSVYTPFLDKVLVFVQIYGIVLIALGLLRLNSLANQLAHVVGVLGPVAGLVSGVLRMVQGYAPAKYFLLGWCFVLGGILIFVLAGMEVIPIDSPWSISMSLGSAIESVLLSFALADRIRRLRKEKEALAASRSLYRRASLTDGLTGLYNLRYFVKRMVQEVRLAGELKRPLSLLIMDLDDFKQFNDTYGHVEGDKVLRRLSAIMHDSARDNDAPCRYGGEEFVLILPGSNLENAHMVAERIRETFQEETFVTEKGDNVKSTVSIGVAQKIDEEDSEGLLRRADEALYLAKNTGKNRSVTA